MDSTSEQRKELLHEATSQLMRDMRDIGIAILIAAVVIIWFSA